MEYGGASLDPEVREGLVRTWKTLRTIGIVAIVVGCLAILLPELFSLGAAVFAGIVLVIAAAYLTAAAFFAHGVGSFLARLAWAFLTFVVGLWLILEPHNGTLTLTLVLGIYFLVMGILRVIVAFAGRGRPNAGWIGLSGICSLIIGILVLAKFPSSADWAIGLLIGIDLIFAGWSLISVAQVGKEISRQA
ncbi:MAG: HdeD family acid-resistance protein [Solirubrobacterales bacterium]